ncbi:hypothetical protein OAP18_02450 [Gammaproteobacteria bacterium]|nr:hypothetical protein [Gammaproteobacteria bacterium]
MRILKYFFLLLVTLTGSCTITQPILFPASAEVSETTYIEGRGLNGVVLLDVNWGRYWGCGSFENAQLLSLAFDKMPVIDYSNQAMPSLVLQSPSRLLAEPIYQTYAFSLPAGEFAISGVSIKVAESMSKVGYYTALRDKLFNIDGQPVGGTFEVNADEAVFIGSFYLDCTYEPILWRYYPNGREAFESHMEEYRSRYPFLDLNSIKFRLFETKEFGQSYEVGK